LSSLERSASFHVVYYQNSWGKEVMIYFVKVTISLFENLQKWLTITLRRFRRDLLNDFLQHLFIVMLNRAVHYSAEQLVFLDEQ
jgi:hypothetical protein